MSVIDLKDKIHVEIMFHNGNTAKMYCDNFKVTVNNSGELTGYSYEGGIAEEQILFMSLKDIVCVRRCDEDGKDS